MRQNQCFGDYPIVATLVHTVRGMGIQFNRGQLRNTLRYSTQLSDMSNRERKHLLDALESAN